MLVRQFKLDVVSRFHLSSDVGRALVRHFPYFAALAGRLLDLRLVLTADLVEVVFACEIVYGRHANLEKESLIAGSHWLLDVIAFSRTARAEHRTFLHPFPVANLRHVVAMLVDVLLVLNQLLVDRLLEVGGTGAELR